jgi:hypothetical protein
MFLKHLEMLYNIKDVDNDEIKIIMLSFRSPSSLPPHDPAILVTVGESCFLKLTLFIAPKSETGKNLKTKAMTVM